MRILVQNILWIGFVICLASCGNYKTIRSMGCIAGLHVRTIAYNLPLLPSMTEEDCYQKLKRIIEKKGYTLGDLANSEKEYALFNPGDTVAISIHVERGYKSKIKIRFYDDLLTKKPTKGEFKSFCRKQFKSLKRDYLNNAIPKSDALN